MILLGVTFACFLIPALWESLRSRRPCEFPTLRRRSANLCVWTANILIAAALFPGRPQVLPWPIDGAAGLIVGFLLLDALSYTIHRAQHAIPLLWRFHVLHHNDPDIDWSTAVRHHPVEHLISTAIFWSVVVLLSAPVEAIAAHSMLVFGLAVMTHANVRLPLWLERAAQPALITLSAHLVHHSIEPDEANTNFGAVLNVWDRLFGTWRRPANVDSITFGVPYLSGEDACKLSAMLFVPWRV